MQEYEDCHSHLGLKVTSTAQVQTINMTSCVRLSGLMLSKPISINTHLKVCQPVRSQDLACEQEAYLSPKDRESFIKFNANTPPAVEVYTYKLCKPSLIVATTDNLLKSGCQKN